MSTSYKLHIKTDAYAGNFEHELCGYCTGHVDAYASRAQEQETDYLMEEGTPGIPLPSVGYRPTRWGGSSPVDCSYDTVIIYFDKMPTESELAVIKRRAEKFVATKPMDKGRALPTAILGYTLEELTTTSSKVKV